MNIRHVEICNFRKLESVRVDFAPDKTVFVGANNSGKTSAMVALRRFLVDPGDFSINDLSISHWKTLNEEAAAWEAIKDGTPIPNCKWEQYLPFIDIWLNVAMHELHYVKKIVPTLDWAGGLLGVRLRYEPKEAEKFQREFLTLRKLAVETIAAAQLGDKKGAIKDEGTDTQSASEELTVSLWPQTMLDFLERRMRSLFVVRGYILNPDKLVKPVDGIATPQKLDEDELPIDGDPFKGLIAVDEINAQRGFGHSESRRDAKGEERSASEPKRLSTQLRHYYADHLDPYDAPEPKDVGALQAMQVAGAAFDVRLKAAFAEALEELEGLGYPGVTDPKLTISTKIKPVEGLNHESAVQYEVPTFGLEGNAAYRLPEHSNGLGYQNLVSMVFALMAFRDRWMRRGKAGKGAKEKTEGAGEAFISPLHLVLVEEPEAHLHAQVQQVFIKQAYAVLRNHPLLKGSSGLTTQLVVSTHSSHVAHACEFANLRYFRRLAANACKAKVPTACVVNLSEVFGLGDKTARFVTRYLKASHCDLFFADGAILVEGPAERILVPHFVEDRVEFEYLKRSYITWLEIGGSHAHTLRSLIEHLGIATLIITDLDAKDGKTSAAVVPEKNKGQRARNETLKTWIPCKELLDDLLDVPVSEKSKDYPAGFSVRVAYQAPMKVSFKADKDIEALSNTFEDALLFTNIPFFTGKSGVGLIAKFKVALEEAATVKDLSDKVLDHLKGGGKAELALDLLYDDDLPKLVVPSYIADGLGWLIEQLKGKEQNLISHAGEA